MSTSFLSFSTSGAVNRSNSCQPRVRINSRASWTYCARFRPCIRLAVDDVGRWANITMRPNDGQPVLASDFHQCSSSCWNVKIQREFLISARRVLLSWVLPSSSTMIPRANQSAWMDHYTSPFGETLNLLGCHYCARLSRKKVLTMSAADMCIKLEFLRVKPLRVALATT